MQDKKKSWIPLYCYLFSLVVLLFSVWQYTYYTPNKYNEGYLDGYTYGSHWAIDTIEKMIIRTKNSDSICDLKIWEGKDTFHIFLTNKYITNGK